jgi:hypothetical protein
MKKRFSVEMESASDVRRASGSQGRLGSSELLGPPERSISQERSCYALEVTSRIQGLIA